MPGYFPALPQAFNTVLSLVVSVLLCYLFVWIVAWMIWWGQHHAFIPWPSL